MKPKPTLLLPVAYARTYVTVSALLGLLLFLLAATTGKSHQLLPLLPQLLWGQADDVSAWLFWQLWLPRALIALGVGAALAIAGQIFQLLTRNPLGSPDIVGINTGAAAGAVAVTLIWPGVLPIAVGAVLGATTVLVLILLASGKRLDFSHEVIIAGLAVNAAALALVQFGLGGVRQEDALQMAVWLSGSLAQRGWPDVVLIWLGFPLLAAAVQLLSRPLGILGMGPVAAAGVGVPVGYVSWTGLLLATALAAVAVATAGPLSFLALAAPHLTRRLLNSQRLLLLPTALTGACLLLGADLTARWLPTRSALPVGVLTAALGGIYLLVLLLTECRKK